ncbi:restriction endonuclease [Streptomyces sp. NPDC001732]
MTAGHPRDDAPAARPATPPSTHTVLYDPHGLIEAELPLDREPYELLVKTVLAWAGPQTLTERDYEQLALQLTGHARAVASDVRRRAAQLPRSDGRGALAEVILHETDMCLSVRPKGTARCVQNRARLVQALYERLDRLAGDLPAVP